MAGLPSKCFRCGVFGHVQLACPNPADPDAKRMANKRTRAQRTGAQHWDYQQRYNLRREAFLKFKGTDSTLHPMVSWEIDQLLDVKDELEDVEAHFVNHLSEATERLRTLKEGMEQKLPGLRELIYTSKHYTDRKDDLFEEKLQTKIFRGHTEDLELLRNSVWEQLWKTERHIALGHNLLPIIIRIKRRMASVRLELLHRGNLRTAGISSELMEEIIKLEQDGVAALDKLFAFCPDPRIVDERDYFHGFVQDIKGMDRDIRRQRKKVEPRALTLNLVRRRPPIGSPF